MRRAQMASREIDVSVNSCRRIQTVFVNACPRPAKTANRTATAIIFAGATFVFA
jgi:hypothetical protein